MTLDATFMGIVSGVGKVFSAFGIIILCGAVIAKILQEQHQIEEIVSDIRKYIKNPPVIAGLSGYLLAVPITCCVTAYVMLNPILDHLERDQQKQNVLLYLAAVGSIISYVTDPFFWLVQRTTGDTITTVVKNYTLPIALAGAGILIVALALEYVVFR